ncbi:hypothetical protein [Streptomyces sp. NPDC048349]|uniref:hypothetical protein n=1 Tax=Streptomyces sp. NPDC048349 TaxID=3155486 RepID=UPI00344AB53D
MQLCRTLTLTLASLTLATGCVTVRPAAAPDAPRPGHPAVRPEPRQPAPDAWPLGHLPVTPEPAPPSAPPAPVPVPAVAGQERPARPPRAAKPVRPAHPAHPARPARPVRPGEPAKPRKRAPAKAATRPAAPQRTYDMTALCEAARGTVSPSIVALCR